MQKKIPKGWYSHGDDLPWLLPYPPDQPDRDRPPRRQQLDLIEALEALALTESRT